MSALPARVKIVEVGARDGLQMAGCSQELLQSHETGHVRAMAARKPANHNGEQTNTQNP